jgi:serine/threonine-protein kinase
MADAAQPERVVGRYVMCDEIAAGGMATVHIGRLLGPVGFARTVAIKRLHPHFAKDPEFVTMLLDEARLAARIRHPNVVPTLDIVVEKGELLVVMDYVQGESLARLAKAAFARKEPIPLGVVMSIMAGALYGLHAAHEATTEQGAPLCVIHRDISPQNIMVGIDGVSRVLDFGVARAVGRIQTTRDGTLKGKLAYMSPEQVRGETLDRRSDLYAVAVVLWEMIAMRRLFVADSEAELLNKVLTSRLEPPSRDVRALPAAVDALVMKGLCRDRNGRFATALEMAEAVQRIAFATTGEVSAWVAATGGATIAARNDRVAQMESKSSGIVPMAAAQRGPGSEASQEAPVSEAASASPKVAAQVGKTDGTAAFGSSSEVSHLSVSKAIPRSVPLGAGLAVLGGSLFLGALVIALLTLKLRAESSPATSGQVLAVASASSAPLPGSVTITLPPPPMPTSPASAPLAPTGEPTTPARPAPRRVVNPRPGKCSPPYTVDSSGIRTPKPECM